MQYPLMYIHIQYILDTQYTIHIITYYTHRKQHERLESVSGCSSLHGQESVEAIIATLLLQQSGTGAFNTLNVTSKLCSNTWSMRNQNPSVQLSQN